MRVLLILISLLLVGCASSFPKTTIPNHIIPLTCEVGSRYFFVNLQDEPKKTGFNDGSFVGDNAWYIYSTTLNPDLNQEPSIWSGLRKKNQKYFLVKPYSVTEDVLVFTTYGATWEVNRNNMKALLFNMVGRGAVLTGTCKYGFQTP